MDDAMIAALSRWEANGGHWELEDVRQGRAFVVLLTCDRGEAMDRLSTADPDTVRFLVTHATDEELED